MDCNECEICESDSVLACPYCEFHADFNTHGDESGTATWGNVQVNSSG